MSEFSQKKVERLYGGAYVEDSEIRSHSSLLNNKNIFALYTIASDQNRQLGSFINLNLVSIRQFFSTTRAIYDEVFMTFTEDENQKIIECRNKIYELIFNTNWALPEGNADESKQRRETVFLELIKLFFKVEEMYIMIKAYLQKRQYFFRKVEADVKGIDRAIEIFEQQGGIFERS